MGFNFNHLYYFHVVATHGSLVKAAKALGVAQSTISTQIKQLEKDLGVDLFERTPEGMMLTEMGRHAFRHTTVMFRAGERLQELFHVDNQSTRQRLFVGVCSSVSRTIATDFLLPLLKLDNCTPRIFDGPHDVMLRRLLANETDLLLTDQMPPAPEKQGLKLIPVHKPILWAIAGHELGVTGEHGLAGIPLLQYPIYSPYRWEIERFLQNHGYEPKIIGEVEDAGLMLSAAMRGVCAAFVPSSLLNAFPDYEKYLVRLAVLDDLETQVVAVYRDLEAPTIVYDAIAVLTMAHENKEKTSQASMD